MLAEEEVAGWEGRVAVEVNSDPRPGRARGREVASQALDEAYVADPERELALELGPGEARREWTVGRKGVDFVPGEAKALGNAGISAMHAALVAQREAGGRVTLTVQAHGRFGTHVRCGGVYTQVPLWTRDEPRASPPLAAGDAVVLAKGSYRLLLKAWGPKGRGQRAAVDPEAEAEAEAAAAEAEAAEVEDSEEYAPDSAEEEEVAAEPSTRTTRATRRTTPKRKDPEPAPRAGKAQAKRAKLSLKDLGRADLARRPAAAAPEAAAEDAIEDVEDDEPPPPAARRARKPPAKRPPAKRGRVRVPQEDFDAMLEDPWDAAAQAEAARWPGRGAVDPATAGRCPATIVARAVAAPEAVETIYSVLDEPVNFKRFRKQLLVGAAARPAARPAAAPAPSMLPAYAAEVFVVKTTDAHRLSRQTPAEIARERAFDETFATLDRIGGPKRRKKATPAGRGRGRGRR